MIPRSGARMSVDRHISLAKVEQVSFLLDSTEQARLAWRGHAVTNIMSKLVDKNFFSALSVDGTDASAQGIKKRKNKSHTTTQKHSEANENNAQSKLHSSDEPSSATLSKSRGQEPKKTKEKKKKNKSDKTAASQDTTDHNGKAYPDVLPSVMHEPTKQKSKHKHHKGHDDSSAPRPAFGSLHATSSFQRVLLSV